MKVASRTDKWNKDLGEAKMENCASFPFWLHQDLRSIYQFWKQLTLIPYSLFFAVKKNSFVHSKFHINFFHFSDETETIFFHQSNCLNDQFRPIRVRREIFYIFALTLYNFR